MGTVVTGPAPVRTQPAPDQWTPWWVSAAMAVAGALAMRLAFPQPGWWPLLLPGLALVLGSAAVPIRRRRAVLPIGLLSGLAFYLPLVHWASLFLGWLPWLALGTEMALWWSLGYLAIWWLHRWARTAWPGPVGTWLLTPLVTAGVWTARDAASSSWPYRGFAWGRLAQSLAWSQLLHLVTWLGLAGTGFVLCLVAAWTVPVARRLVRPGAPPSRRVLPLTALLAFVLGLVAVPAFPVATQGTIRVAGIQGGDERAGYFMGGQPGDVLAAHLRASRLIAPGTNPDVVAWPEGAAEWDPAEWPELQSRFDNLSAALGAPLLLGSSTERGGKTYQSEYVWPMTGGQREIYDKRNPVPFGEYVPDRDTYAKIAPALIGLIGRDVVPGTGDPVLSVTTRDGRTTGVGLAICYDIIDDALARESVHDGAQWLLSPTNNADFGRTDELDQQLAFARLRAVETGRALVQVSTVGHTAAFAPDGRVLARVPWYTPEAMVVDVPLSTTLTPAVRFGALLQGIGTGVGLVGLLSAAAVTQVRRHRLPGSSTASPRLSV
ncbi:apolipoprotein N-acyltransferase [Raineyella fluvialis]|uniref:Apolipoprotein N-acyltransferase n=1 Tax=Raineyella fluvialis TaxID=2662261 RepID=A0A5Q2FEB9_9ACTN|nr:apolipoprotein N-acyltransferase [Raineyella fluvialis]QGF24731.1 apolipoprotein N-acyltransferase [Raineyella fluvialis]